jgi:hypothetical protein
MARVKGQGSLSRFVLAIVRVSRKKNIARVKGQGF